MLKTLGARLGLILLLALVAAGPAMSGQLSELFWDDQIPIDLREGVQRAMGAKVGELTKEKNEHDKTFVYAYPTKLIQIVDGKPVTYLTLQRCLDDKMVTERWRFVLEQKSADARDYEIVSEEKIWETGDKVPVFQQVSAPRPIKPFTYKDDMLEFSMSEGSYLLTYAGDLPYEINIVGKGRMKLAPIDRHEERFFERQLDTKRVDTEIDAIKISFHTSDLEFLELIGADPEGPGKFKWSDKPEDIKLPPGFDVLLPNINETAARAIYKPYGYRSPSDPLERGNYAITFFTKDHDTLVYLNQPTAVEQVSVYKASRAISLDAEDLQWAFVTQYPGPELRAQPYEVQERQGDMRKIMPKKYEAQLDIDDETFVATVEMELLFLEKTDVLGFGLAGNPKVRYVVDRDTGDELPYVPTLGVNYWGAPQSNFFEIKLPREYKPGERLRVVVSYNSPAMISKFDEGFWRVGRGGFLPFHAIIQDPVFVSFTVRTSDEYDHIVFGNEAGRERKDGYLYTKWVSDHTQLFPTLTVGQFFETVSDEIDGVKVRGFATKMAVSEYSMLKSPRKGMITEVEKAKSALASYNRMYKVKYPFKELKIVSVPAQGYAQGPSGVLYMDEGFLLPPALLAQFGRLDPTSRSGTTAHEVGHQWWGGLVSNANSHHYWFVEGFAELGSALYEEQVCPGAFEDALRNWREDIFDSEHWCALKDDSQRWFGYNGPPAPPLRYTKGPYVFSMLGEYFGYDKLVEYMQVVMAEHSGDLITTSDLQQIAERVFGRKLDWYFDQWIREVGIPTISYNVSTRQEGGQWKLDYEFEQEIMVNKKVEADRHFRLVIPVSVKNQAGDDTVIKIPLNDPKASGSFDLPFKPRGTPVVNPGNKMLFRKQSL